MLLNKEKVAFCGPDFSCGHNCGHDRSVFKKCVYFQKLNRQFRLLPGPPHFLIMISIAHFRYRLSHGREMRCVSRHLTLARPTRGHRRGHWNRIWGHSGHDWTRKWSGGYLGKLTSGLCVADRRQAEQTAIFARELRYALISDRERSGCRANARRMHQPPRFDQAKLLLEL